MQNTLTRIGFTSLVALFSFCFFVGQVESKTIQVDCDKKKTIQDDGLLSAVPGDVIEVSGTCNENVAILEEVHRITLDGQGTATINGGPLTTTGLDVIRVRGTGITIRGFTITGGGNGVNVVRGGTVVIDGNTIENTGRNGVRVNNSRVNILNNIIQNIPGAGIFLANGSDATIGFSGPPDARVAEPNTIQNNVGDGKRAPVDNDPVSAIAGDRVPSDVRGR